MQREVEHGVEADEDQSDRVRSGLVLYLGQLILVSGTLGRPLIRQRLFREGCELCRRKTF